MFFSSSSFIRLISSLHNITPPKLKIFIIINNNLQICQQFARKFINKNKIHNNYNIYILYINIFYKINGLCYYYNKVVYEEKEK